MVFHWLLSLTTSAGPQPSSTPISIFQPHRFMGISRAQVSTANSWNPWIFFPPFFCCSSPPVYSGHHHIRPPPCPPGYHSCTPWALPSLPGITCFTGHFVPFRWHSRLTLGTSLSPWNPRVKGADMWTRHSPRVTTNLKIKINHILMQSV